MSKVRGYLLTTSIVITLFISVNTVNAYVLESDSSHLSQGELLLENNGVLSPIGDGKSSFGYIQTSPVTTRLYSDGSSNREFLTQLGFSQDLDGQTLHFAGEVSSEKNLLNVGVTIGKTTIAVGQGSGSENAWLSNNDFSSSNYFKQGFTPASYSYQGVNIQQQLTDSLGINTSSINVKLDGRVDPSVYTLGLNYKNFAANTLSTQRNGVTIGKGLSLAYQHDNINAAFDQYKDYGGFKLNTLQLSFDQDKKGATYGLELASGHSPFNGLSDNRMLLTYKKRWGQDSYSLSAAAKAKNRGNVPTTAILLGVGVAAAVGASGGSSSSNGDGGSGGFATQHEAAKNVLNSINPTSVRENLEYGGWIARQGDNTYASTVPVRGTVASVNLGPLPAGATASYHTHAGPDPKYDNEHFSPQDLQNDRDTNTDGYLGTPAGDFRYHNVATGVITSLGTIAN